MIRYGEKEPTFGRLTPNQQGILNKMLDSENRVTGYVDPENVPHLFFEGRKLQQRMIDRLMDDGFTELEYFQEAPKESGERDVEMKISDEGKTKIFLHRLRSKR
jgi:hypothetical protein